MSNRTAVPNLISHAGDDVLVGTAPTFSEVLRERTALVHREAERTGFIADLIRGRATRAGYALFLRNLVPVYDELESGLAHVLDRGSGEGCSNTILSSFAGRGLSRLGALQADLRTIAGSGWEADLPLLPAASCYAQAVQEAAKSERLAAHAYARYLGDLSGGQILKPVLARNLGLPAEALTFYDFPKIVDPVAAKAAIRAALDRVDVGSEIGSALVEEAIAAFRHNIALSLAVQAAAD